MADVERIAYGSDPANILDLYYPSGGPVGKPAVILYHGGFLQTEEDVETRHHAASRFAAEGYVVVAPDYREWGHPGWPAQIQDTKAVIGWVRGAGATKYRFDGTKVGAVGFSLGGGLVGLLATTKSAKPDVAATWSGPLDPPTFGPVAGLTTPGGVCGVFINGSLKPNPVDCATVSAKNRIATRGVCPIRVVKGSNPQDFVPDNQLTGFVNAIPASVPHESHIWAGEGHAEAYIDHELPMTLAFFKRFIGP